ncbi:hypothetical protein [Desulforamulus aquiferis]|uniref:FecR protein domain-containing protein n=1 Tax=Desulforamulus aquiferis TaxID=1397668 RepID=A0AAW7ZAZ9_9FIRM|nr:hypothetical protein [Desulforamulus aquiferis]MDO7786893.1 hypothetical protein [Desulforamulus aquiferis]
MTKFKDKPKLFIIALLTLIALLAFKGLAGAGQGDPGSSTDPLVTQSYVQKYVDDKIKQQTSQNTGGWEVITVQAGQTFAGHGGTEFVLRSGKAVAVDPSTSGILNMTSGGNVLANQAVPANHLLMVPRADGRGFTATTQVIIMCKGGFDIQ